MTKLMKFNKNHLNLITPPSHVSEAVNRHADVCLESEGVDCTRVDGLEGGQLLLVLLHQVS